MPASISALERVVALLAGQLGEGLEVGDGAVERVDELDVVAELRELGGDLAGRGPGRPRGRAC